MIVLEHLNTRCTANKKSTYNPNIGRRTTEMHVLSLSCEEHNSLDWKPDTVDFTAASTQVKTIMDVEIAPAAWLTLT
jgi:hypothetical protein